MAGQAGATRDWSGIDTVDPFSIRYSLPSFPAKKLVALKTRSNESRELQ
jgi:hypothetical protein